MKRQETKRSLFLSVISLLLCFAMLIGNTFAWFTAVVKTEKNEIVVGNLDVEMEYSLDFEDWKTVNTTTKLFIEDALWQPGYSEVVYLKVKNAGDLSLRYQLSIKINEEQVAINKNDKIFKLSDYIQVGAVKDIEAGYSSNTDAILAVENDAIALSTFSKNGVIEAGGSDQYFALVVYMPESVGNAANYRGDAPTIDFGVSLYATQMEGTIKDISATELSNFTANEVYFLAGEESDVCFTVNAGEDITKVTLFNENDDIIGVMNDDGLDGDAVANDGMYTYILDVLVEAPDSMGYYAKSSTDISETIYIYWFDEPTENTNEEVLSIEESIDKIEEPYLNEFGYVNSQDVNAVVKDIGEYAKTLYESGLAIKYEITDNSVFIKLSNGVGIAYSPKVEGVYSSGNTKDMSVAVYQPEYDWVANSTDAYIELPDYISNREDLLISVASQIDDTFENYTYTQTYLNDRVNLSLVNNFGKNQIILWQGHGIWLGEELHSVIMTGKEYDSNVGNWWDILQDRIVNYRGLEAFSYKYIEEYCGDLSGSLIYLGPCQSGYDSVLADTFLNKGASAVVAHTDTVLALYGDIMQYTTMKYMTMLNPSTNNYYTLYEALSEAKSLYGEDDSQYWDKEPCEVVIFGGEKAGNYRLHNLVQNDVIYSNLPTLSAEKAAVFFGFLHNKNYTLEELEDETWYQIMIGEYTGDDLIEQSKALVSWIIGTTNEMSTKAVDNSNYLDSIIINYLKKTIEGVSIEEEFYGDVVNEMQNKATKKLMQPIYDHIDKFLKIPVDSIFSSGDVLSACGSIKGAVDKGKKLSAYIVSGVAAGCKVLEAEKAGRYTYFSLYLQNRRNHLSIENNLEFETMMASCEFYVTQNNNMAKFIDLFTWLTNKDSFLNHIDLIEEWAEYTYQLNLYCDNYALEDNNTDIEDEIQTPSDGLAYTLNSNKTSYSVSGIGTCKDTKLTIPETYDGKPVAAITAEAFKNCTQLISVVVPASVKEIGKGAFSGCSSIESMTIPFVGASPSPGSALHNEKNCFGYIFGSEEYDGSYCASQYTFCIDSKSFYIPETLKNVTMTGNCINYGSFSCLNIPNIQLTGNVSSIPSDAFANNIGITEMRIPAGCTEIGYTWDGLSSGGVFSGCENLQKVYIPINLKNIDYGCFNYCNNLTDVYYEGSKDDWEAINIDDGNSYLINATIHYNYRDESTAPGINKDDQIGDIITFGEYEQDNNISNGKEPIEWFVLDVQNGKALVISKYALDGIPYNTSRNSITWETCTLRTWLNSDFINSAFSAEEQALIQTVTVSADPNPFCSTDPGNATEDKVFLLSMTEANKYFSYDSRKLCQATAYAVAQDAYANSSNGNCCWWLRSPGVEMAAAFVYDNGDIAEGGCYVDDGNGAVRPAMWIDLNYEFLIEP